MLVMERKGNFEWILLGIIAMVGFLYTINPFDLNTQIYLVFYVFMIIAGLYILKKATDRVYEHVKLEDGYLFLNVNSNQLYNNDNLSIT
jgi:uncharacterized membrane protein